MQWSHMPATLLSKGEVGGGITGFAKHHEYTYFK